ncbi:MAG TPA: carotenoid biosynthesis protein [Armatimonadota bacterium]|nr:carotenoid biosynthesis protein [Armatimonadota bacterium]
MSPASLRHGAGALIVGNLALVVFALLGTAAVRAGLPVPPVNFERLAGVVAQISILLGVLAALALMVASQGLRPALFLLGSSTLVGGGSEWLSLTTGLPFGRYSYTALLGPMLWGGLPALIPLAWFTLCASALLLGHRLVDRPVLVVAGAALLVTLHDLVLDPAMTTGLAAWQWHDGGAYYGIPLTNFLAWSAVSALIVAVFGLFHRNWRPDVAPHALQLYLVQGLLPAGLALVYGRGGASVLWALGVGVLWVSLRRARPGGENL